MDDNTELRDEVLAELVQKGDKEKFGVLMHRYGEKLFRYGRRFLSERESIEDIVQDVFMNTYKNIQSFDTSQKFSSWIYRIAHNAFVNELKRSSRNPLTFFDFDFDTLISYSGRDLHEADGAVHDIEQKEMKTMVDRGLEKLSPKYKEIIILHYVEDLSYKEISDVLAIPVGTVGIRLKRAKDSLRKTYEKLDLTFTV